MSQYHINDSTNCVNNTNSFNVWNNYTVADDRSQLLAWLSLREARLRHRDLQERRVEDVGEWLIQSEEFRRWHDWNREGEGDNAVLFCYGDPGAGKTFMSSLVVDRLCDQASGQNTVVTCFYFDFAARKEQSATSMLGSLLKQIVSGMETVPEEISRAFQEQKKATGGRGPQLLDIIKMLQATTSAQRTFVCIDAVDECAAVHRVKLLDSVREILKKSPGTRIFITGRPHIRAELEKRLPKCVVSVSIGPRKDDITRYIRVKLGQDETPDAMNESLAADILEKIPENMSEMFLLVSLNIEAILHESTIHRRRERLNKMAAGLDLGDVYTTTIEWIRAQDGDKSRLGMAALMWISHAQRPLRADELCHALGVELDSPDFNTDNVPSVPTLVSCCQGLITVDKETSTVRLIHYTLQEYLSAHPDIFGNPHSTIAEICLTYLNSQQVKALSADPFLDTQATPFLEYCSVYWGVHAKRQLSDCARSLALNLLKENYGQTSARLLIAQAVDTFIEHMDDTPYLFSGLHCASFFGIAEVVAALVEMGCYDINEEDFLGCTPFTWAARNGHKEVVKILVEREEVNPDKPGYCARTPLAEAARQGHEGVVKALLGRADVNPDKPDENGRTPLSLAARNGHEGVVKMLLGREEVSLDKMDHSGQTPLSFAARFGHEKMVKILLEREEVNLDKPDNGGRTPLSLAAWFGHEKVVKILLGREEVSPDKTDSSGQTPLSLAAKFGHEGVVKILLGREEVNPDKPDNRGQTPLSFAAWFGHEGVVKILLGREEVSPDKPDHYNRTPLSHAAGEGHEGVVEILLERGQVNPDKPDNYGRTPLSFAASRGSEGVVKILLEQEEVSPDKPDYYGRIPLSHAADGGHERVVKILLQPEEVDPSKPDKGGRTPLLFAASCGSEGVVKMLLAREEVNANQADNSGRTPLSMAASYGHTGVVSLLQSRQAVAPSTIQGLRDTSSRG